MTNVSGHRIDGLPEVCRKYGISQWTLAGGRIEPAPQKAAETACWGQDGGPHAGNMLALFLAACTPTAVPSPSEAPAKPAAAAPTIAPAAAPTAPSAPAKPTAAPAVRAKVDKITYAIAAVGSPMYWPMYVGRKKGFYQKENIDLDFLLVTGAPGQLQALVANAATVSGVQVQSTITAIEKGAINAHILGNLVSSLPYIIVAQKDIKNIAGLKGKRYAVSAVTGGEVALTKKVLATAGLKIEDVDLISAGVVSQRIAALKGGAVAGTLVFPPDDGMLAAEGYTILSRMNDLLGEFPFISYTVTDDFAKANGELLVRFFRATYSANQWLFNQANKDEAIKVLIEETKMDVAAAQASYEPYVGKAIFSKDMVLGEKGMKAVLDLMVEVGDLKPPLPDWQKYLDLSFLEKATKQ